MIFSNKKKKIIFIIISALVVVLVLGALAVYYRYYSYTPVGIITDNSTTGYVITKTEEIDEYQNKITYIY